MEKQITSLLLANNPGSIWEDYINAVVELDRCRFVSGGVIFKIHLK